MKNNYLTGDLMIHHSVHEQIMMLNAQDLSGTINPNAKIKEVSISLASSDLSQISITSDQLATSNNIDDDQEQFVLVLNITGVIVKYSDWYNVGTQSYMRILDSIKNDSRIAGVVLRMDTGGGLVHGTPDFADYLRAFNSIKPIVAFVDGYCCSAGLWIAAGAKFIIASKNADAIGSAGTYGTVVDYSEFYKAMGIKVVTIYADESPNKNYNSRKVFDEKEASTEPYKKNISSKIIAKFHSFITEGRTISEEALTGIEYFYDSEQAKSNGIIDEIGTIDDAIAKVFELSKKSNKSENQNNMSQSIKYVALATALGVAAIETKKGFFDKEAKANFSLTEEQLDALETALTNGGGDVSQIAQLTADLATARTELTAAKTAQATAETSLNTLTADISKQMKDRKLEDKGSATANVAELSAKVAEFGARGDAAPTNVTTKEEVTRDENTDPSDKSTSIFDSI